MPDTRRARTDAMYHYPARGTPGWETQARACTHGHVVTLCGHPRVFGERPLVLSVNRFPMSFASAVSPLYITINHVLAFVHAVLLSERIAFVAAASCVVKLDRHFMGVGAHVAPLSFCLADCAPARGAHRTACYQRQGNLRRQQRLLNRRRPPPVAPPATAQQATWIALRCVRQMSTPSRMATWSLCTRAPPA